VPSLTSSSVTRAFVRSLTLETIVSMALSSAPERSTPAICGVNARAVSVSARSFWSRSEDFSCGVT
jgi:hypothetical protein